MAKREFKELYCIRAVYRLFGTNPTIAMYISSDPEALTGVRVYRGLDHAWVKKAVTVPTDDIEDQAELDLVKNADGDLESLGKGYTFSENVPPLFQYIPTDNGEVSRVIDTVSGVIMASDNLTVDSVIRRTMLFRLTATDDEGNHRYGIPTRRRYWEDLAEYFVGEGTKDYDEFTKFVNNLDEVEMQNMEE